MLTAEIKEALASLTGGRTLIITLGNTLRSDDGVGPYIYQELKNAQGNFDIMNAGERPEDAVSHAAEIKPPKTVIIDAADFGGRAGEIRVIDASDIPDTTLSTHTFPPAVLAKIIKEDTGGDVIFVGVQAKDLGFGEGLSDEVRSSAGEIIAYLKISCGGPCS